MPHNQTIHQSSMILRSLSILLLSMLALPAISVPAPATADQLNDYSPQSEYNDWTPESGNDSWSPETQTFQIHPNGDETKCLDVLGSAFEDGAPVDIYDCNGTPAQDWSIQPGTTKVKVAGQNFCLDAGTYPTDGTKMKIWTCYDDLPAQTWYYTDDHRIALQDQGKCLDLTDGNTENYTVMQIWACTDGNTNQIWTV